MRRRSFLAVLAGGCLALSLPSSSRAERSLAFTGVSATGDSNYVFLGAITALNGKLDADGALLRASIGHGKYHYDNPGVPGGKVDGTIDAADGMVGYQKFFGPGAGLKGGRVTAFVGGSVETHRLSPSDNANLVRGEQDGFKYQLETLLDLTEKSNLLAMGSYTSSHRAYWSSVRWGWKAGPFTLGPEGVFMGSRSFNQRRVGAFLGDIRLAESLKASAAVGYSSASHQGKSGPYGTFTLVATF